MCIRDSFQAVVDRIECRHGKNTSVAGQTPILVQDEQRIRQQLDNVFGFGLLAVAADPPLALRILLDPVIGQRGHIRIADARKAGEQEQMCIRDRFTSL